MNRGYIRKNIVFISTLVFLVAFYVIQLVKPAFLYNPNGSIKQFGLGYKFKTILPMWLITMAVAIFAYLGVLYYLAIPKLNY